MLNYKEVGLILSEIPLIDSYIQDIRESDFHSFTISFFHKQEKAFNVYFEIATSTSHFSLTNKTRKKSAKTQRFTQFLKARIIGSRIIEVHQLNYDRAFYLKLLKDNNISYLLFRFYSGPGANVILSDSNFIIQDLLLRRPKRGEITGQKLIIEERTIPPGGNFEVREHPNGISFNEFIDLYYDSIERAEDLSSLKEKAERAREKELREIDVRIKKLKEKIKNTESFENNKKIADLLSSNLYAVKKGMEDIIVDDYESGGKIRIPLKKELSARENLEHYYKAYAKDKTAYNLSLEDLKREEERYKERKKYYDDLISSEDLKKLREVESDEKKREGAEKRYHGPSFLDNGYILILGRNSKENDEILRHDARGNDLWLHTRDYAGGYVIIKTQKGKEVPFNIILDAAHLAVHYSKAKDIKSVDLYYTYVKYLRRAKNGKEGLVLPTQEKNLALRVDDDKMKEILSKRID